MFERPGHGSFVESSVARDAAAFAEFHESPRLDVAQQKAARSGVRAAPDHFLRCTKSFHSSSSSVTRSSCEAGRESGPCAFRSCTQKLWIVPKNARLKALRTCDVHLRFQNLCARALLHFVRRAVGVGDDDEAAAATQAPGGSWRWRRCGR